MPSETSGRPIFADFAAKRMSHASAISRPPPNAKPLIAASTGFVLFSMRNVSAWPASAFCLPSSTPCLARVQSGDVTLHSLAAGLAERGLKVDAVTVWNFLRREGKRFKKNGAWR